MELAIRLHIEKLPEGPFLATSDDLQGLIVQADSMSETIELAKSVAKTLLECHRERNRGDIPHLPLASEITDCTIIVAA